MADNKLSSLLQEMAASFAGTIQQLSGAPAQPSISPQDSHDPAVFLELWCQASLQDEPQCHMALGCDRSTGLFLARAMMSETPAETDTWSANDDELITEFFKQAIGRISDDLSGALKGRKLEYKDAKSPDWTPATSANLDMNLRSRTLHLVLQLSMEMVRRIAAGEEQPRPAPEIQTAPQRTEPALPSANNLQLLLDVPLAVTLRFGQRRMPLREILQLASGSVVELDRQAEDAVDLLLDERIIAHGQVVVVDGCYGLRVTEVCR